MYVLQLTRCTPDIKRPFLDFKFLERSHSLPQRENASGAVQGDRPESPAATHWSSDPGEDPSLCGLDNELVALDDPSGLLALDLAEK